ncbi:MAG: carbohydrate ABC transporter permease, partial [Leucobacter sp.]
LGSWAKFRRVTLPQLRPMTVFATVMAVLQSVQVFDTINVMTEGGPLGSTETVLTMTWRLGFVYFDLGQAAALSSMLLIVLVLIGVARRRAFTGDKETA